MDYARIFLTACGGFGLFIYGMHVLASGLQKMAGGKMKKLLEALTRNKFLGVLVGAGVTAIIQSSSATTVMVVGFVNAGLMELSQAVGVIMGANIGTTATAWIVSSVEWASLLKPDNIAPVAMTAGACLVLFTKTPKTREGGEIVAGFGMLFLGMGLMSSGLAPLAQSETFREMFLLLGSNPFLGLLAGLAVTAIIQSSSASVGILQSLAMTGLVPWNAAVYIIMGQNIGTCVTALLSSIGATRNARAAAYTHLLFNVAGSVIFSTAAIIYFKFFNAALGAETISSTQISVVHTSFNVATTALLFGFSGVLVAIAKKMSSAGVSAPDEAAATFLDERVLSNPHAAVGNVIEEMTRLGNMSLENLKTASESFLELDADKAEQVEKREKNIDALTDLISKYMVKILSAGVSEKENEQITALFKTLSDIERVGDHAENISELSRGLISDNTAFSHEAHLEIKEMLERTIQCFGLSIEALHSDDRKAAEEVKRLEDEIDGLEEKFRDTHIRRLAEGICSIAGDVAFTDALTDLERISDHAKNIAKVVLKENKHTKHGV